MKLIKRYLEEDILFAMSYMPVVSIAGARQVGKSTLAQLISGSNMSYVSLDDSSQLDAALNDPIGFFDSKTLPLIVDEIQRAPSLFRTIKMIVDEHKTAGQILLTGSANILSLPKLSDSLAGRMKVVELYPLSQFELNRCHSTFLQRAFSNKPIFDFEQKSQAELINIVLTGGYPNVIEKTERQRQGWHTAYLHSIIERDIKEVAQINKFVELNRLVKIIGQLATQEFVPAALAQQVSIDQKTVVKYIFALEQIYLIKLVPAWHRNELKKIVKKPKLHFLDSGLLASVQKITESKIRQKRQLFGCLLETFVFNELLKVSRNTIVDGIKEEFEIYHYRDAQKNEVDFVIEDSNGDAIGIEVKSSQTASQQQFKGLLALSRYTKLKAGFVIYTGEDFLSFGNNMYAVPLQALFV